MRNMYRPSVFFLLLTASLVLVFDANAQRKKVKSNALKEQKTESESTATNSAEEKKERKANSSPGQEIEITDPAYSLFSLKALGQLAQDKRQSGESVFDHPIVFLLSRTSIAAASGENMMLSKMLPTLSHSESGAIPCVVVKDDRSLPVAILFNGIESMDQFLSFPYNTDLSGLLIPNPEVLIKNLSTKQELFASPKMLYGWIKSQNLNVKSYLQKPRAVGSTESPSLPVSE
jgi:hypothetical protein